MDGSCPLGHYPDCEGPKEWWLPVRAHRPLHHPPLGNCLQDHLDGLYSRLEACSASLRDYPLNGFSFHYCEHHDTQQYDKAYINIAFPFIRILNIGNAYI